jgi:hypothetical protein
MVNVRSLAMYATDRSLPSHKDKFFQRLRVVRKKVGKCPMLQCMYVCMHAV